MEGANVVACAKWIAVFIIWNGAQSHAAVEVLSSPLTSRLGVGAGIRAENQYSDVTPTIHSAFSLSQDFRWRNLQGLLEWTRWTERGRSGNYSSMRRQDLFEFFMRVEAARVGWLGLFFGAGVGFQQDKVEMIFGASKKVVNGGLDTNYGAEVGATIYAFPKFEGQIFGRLLSLPHDTRWTQWVGARVAYQIF